jgi:anthranilate synthase/aminodeoxychorismate synthase-like glutamine amidotransferase
VIWRADVRRLSAVATPMLLMIDNYDSFTYNLVQYLGELGAEVEVYRNDQITLDRIAALEPASIVISPGPCDPDRAGISLDVIRRFAGQIPLLGVCLGHQCIGQAFGGHIVRAKSLMHGKTSRIEHDNRGVFRGLPQGFVATRYHSLVVERETFPAVLEISAWTDDGEIMGLRHRELAVEGVQFHPESILTTAGKKLLANFLESAAA